MIRPDDAQELLRRKNFAITQSNDADRAYAARLEALSGLLALEAGNYDYAMVSLISAASVAAMLAGKPIQVTRAA